MHTYTVHHCDANLVLQYRTQVGKIIMKPITLAHSLGTAVANVSVFNSALASMSHPNLIRLLPHVQAWYAVKQDDGEYLFAPSKFIGYARMTPELYIEETGAGGRLDGRVTEKKLSAWAVPITADDERHDDLHALLSQFCAAYGASPNARARISVFRNAGDSRIPTEDDQVKALSILISALSSDAKRNLKKLAWP